MNVPVGLMVLCGWLAAVASDLVVNVRNQGGESYKQTIRANLSDETITLEFSSHDGSHTTLTIDFKNEMQVVHVTRLSDQDEYDLLTPVLKTKRYNTKPRLSLYKSYCFVTKFKPNEFIPVDAMAKLRQKNPWSLRSPERTELPQNITFDVMLDATACSWISPAIPRICVGSSDFAITTYAVREQVSEKTTNPEDYLRSIRDILVEKTEACDRNYGESCVCSVPVCIGWYPCALKFCRTRSSGGGNSSSVASPAGEEKKPGDRVLGSTTLSPDNFKTYRCGIHTCRVCRNYIFGVRSTVECV